MFKRNDIIACIVLAFLLMVGCNQENGEQKDDSKPKAQEDEISEISDEELKQFMTATQHIQSINQETQRTMANVVRQEGLEIQRFNEIQQAQLNSQQEVDATEEEMKQYEKTIEQLEQEQIKARQEMEDKIEAEGLTVDRYEEIVTAIQSDPEVQEKLRTMYPQN